MPTKLALAQNDDADTLLAKDPLALLIGMVLDQQVPLEWAFHGPHALVQRLGMPLEAAALAAMDQDALVTVFCDRPALHRYPAAMARRVHELCRLIVDQYGGNATSIWSTATDGAELYKRVKALPGFGEMKAKIFVALLAKQFGVAPPGWEKVAGDYGKKGTYLSVADIVDTASLNKVRDAKAQKKAAAKAAKAAAAAASQ
ncbi:MAG TPA: HhH-GPD-type base excision DNA repair protein [Acidimicrobiales bacterium]|nr:HhH-GPD-type base excision DNA repair protein [Acidimicrobiales bacterium]